MLILLPHNAYNLYKKNQTEKSTTHFTENNMFSFIRFIHFCILRVDHNQKIRNRRQRTDIGKYSFVNRTIEHWNQLPAEILEPLPCNSTTFRKRVRKVISEEH